MFFERNFSWIEIKITVKTIISKMIFSFPLPPDPKTRTRMMLVNPSRKFWKMLVRVRVKKAREKVKEVKKGMARVKAVARAREVVKRVVARVEKEPRREERRNVNLSSVGGN